MVILTASGQDITMPPNAEGKVILDQDEVGEGQSIAATSPMNNRLLSIFLYPTFPLYLTEIPFFGSYQRYRPLSVRTDSTFGMNRRFQRPGVQRVLRGHYLYQTYRLYPERPSASVNSSVGAHHVKET